MARWTAAAPRSPRAALRHAIHHIRRNTGAVHLLSVSRPMQSKEESLLHAALRGDLPELQQALAAGADPAKQVVTGGLRPLHAAAAAGLAAAVPLLVAAGAAVDGQVFDYWPALDELHSRGWLELGSPLVGALNTASDGATALHIAAVRGDAATVQALLDAGEMDWQAQMDWQALPWVSVRWLQATKGLEL